MATLSTGNVARITTLLLVVDPNFVKIGKSRIFPKVNSVKIEDNQPKI
jgi:hypothetical protein